MSENVSVDPNRVAALAALARLGRWLREHNRTALAAAAASLLLAAVGWGLFYLGGYTLLILGGSISRSLDGLQLEQANDFSALRTFYGPIFLAAASALTGLAALLTHWSRAKVWHDELGTVSRALVDAALFPAALLVDGLDSLRALVQMRASDRAMAVALLARLDASQGRLALGQLSLDIPDRPQLLRILQNLHLAQVLSTRTADGEVEIGWHTREARHALGILRPPPAPPERIGSVPPPAAEPG